MCVAEHYVPILRWKMAERLALKELQANDRKMITPLIEITPKTFDAPKAGKNAGRRPDPGRVLRDQAKDLLESWKNATLFLDLGLIDGKVPPITGVSHPLAHIADTARNCKLCVVPVTGLGRRDEYQTAVSAVIHQDKRGLCLRLRAAEVLETKFEERVTSLLKKIGLDEGSVDLLLDYETFDSQNPALRALLVAIPGLSCWRSLIVACGAFPADLKNFQLGSSRISRDDWLSWRGHFFDESIPRRASFSDYTIQWGHYKEPVKHCIPSVSLRYTLENEWLIMRGEAPRTKKGTSGSSESRPGLEQWYGHAQILCGNDDAFYGENYSWGDRFIYEKSARKGKPGSYEIWLRAGINHHMTVVSRQIANLAAP